MIVREYSAFDTCGKSRVYVDVECIECKVVYTRQKRQLKEPHLCSPKCISLYNGNSVIISCAYCGEEFRKQTSKLINSKSGLYFCCREHKDLGQSTIKEIQPDHYGIGNGKYNYRQRAIKEYGEVCQMCGFDNPLAIVVHHIDHDRSNNEIDNLIVLCANCHYIAHEGSFTGE